MGREGDPDYYYNGIEIRDSARVVITGAGADGGRALIDGNGKTWWNKLLFGELSGAARPRLVAIENNSDVLVENLRLVNSPEKHLMLNAVRGEARFITVEVDRRYQQDLKRAMRARRFGFVVRPWQTEQQAAAAPPQDPLFPAPAPAPAPAAVDFLFATGEPNGCQQIPAALATQQLFCKGPFPSPRWDGCVGGAGACETVWRRGTCAGHGYSAQHGFSSNATGQCATATAGFDFEHLLPAEQSLTQWHKPVSAAAHAKKVTQAGRVVPLDDLRPAAVADAAYASLPPLTTTKGLSLPPAHGHYHFNWMQPEDLNTDGIDPSGSDVFVHDCSILNDDDSVTVKPGHRGDVGQDGTFYNCSEDIRFQNLVLTGFGASVGSVGPGNTRPCVDRITFRNISMPYTGRGIYVKSNGDPCTDPDSSSQLSNILFEDVVVQNSPWWSIWIGPQQMAEPHEKELNSGKCALAYPLVDRCPAPACADFRNITLRNVAVIDPLMAPGALVGNVSNPMEVFFDNVKVTTSKSWMGQWPWKGTYLSENVVGTCVNGCDPLPDGFTEL